MSSALPIPRPLVYCAGVRGEIIDMRKIGWAAALLGTIVIVVFVLAAASGPPALTEGEKAAIAARAAAYHVHVVRDRFGVPHVFGKTDADVGFGIGFAHSE